MPQCFVSTCGNYYGKTRKASSGIIYHMFPQSRTLALKWAEVCGGKKGCLPPTYTRVCSQHFSTGCYQRDLQHELLGLPLRRRLKSDAIPDMGLPNQNSKKKKCTQTKQSEKSAKYAAMRSSIRIAAKRSVEELENVKRTENTIENKENKLKFMENLKLKYGGMRVTDDESGKINPVTKSELRYSCAERGVGCR